MVKQNKKIIDNNSLSSKLSKWIGVLFILLIISNYAFFVIYQYSHTEEDLPTQLWEYFSSQMFQGITAALLAPIIFFFLENRLKFLEAIKKDKEKKIEIEEEEQNERQRLLQELVQKHLLQFEEIASSFWNRLNNIIFDEGLAVMNDDKHREEGEYFLNSTLYILACLFAFKRIFILDGIYAKIGQLCPGLDDIIKKNLNAIA